MKNYICFEYSKPADILGVYIDTLREWDKEGKLTPVKTPGNHRRYRIEDIEAFCGELIEKKRNLGSWRFLEQKIAVPVETEGRC